MRSRKGAFSSKCHNYSITDHKKDNCWANSKTEIGISVVGSQEKVENTINTCFLYIDERINIRHRLSNGGELGYFE